MWKRFLTWMQSLRSWRYLKAPRPCFTERAEKTYWPRSHWTGEPDQNLGGPRGNCLVTHFKRGVDDAHEGKARVKTPASFSVASDNPKAFLYANPESRLIQNWAFQNRCSVFPALTNTYSTVYIKSSFRKDNSVVDSKTFLLTGKIQQAPPFPQNKGENKDANQNDPHNTCD